MEYSGEFETHVTVLLPKSHQFEAFQSYATQHGLKCLHILLDRGLTASQPMITCRGQGTYQKEFEKAVGLSENLNRAGFTVTRVKIEAMPTASGVPQTNADAENHPQHEYFEHHIKLLVSEKTDWKRLEGVAIQHSAHLSRNALRQVEEGFREHFVTQRCRMVGHLVAHEQLERLCAALRKLEQKILDIEEEYVIYDSNLDLDAGWLEGIGAK